MTNTKVQFKGKNSVHVTVYFTLALLLLGICCTANSTNTTTNDYEALTSTLPDDVPSSTTSIKPSTMTTTTAVPVTRADTLPECTNNTTCGYSTTPKTTGDGNDLMSKPGVIAGIAVGAVAILILCCICTICYKCRKNSNPGVVHGKTVKMKRRATERFQRWRKTVFSWSTSDQEQTTYNDLVGSSSTSTMNNNNIVDGNPSGETPVPLSSIIVSPSFGMVNPQYNEEEGPQTAPRCPDSPGYDRVKNIEPIIHVPMSDLGEPTISDGYADKHLPPSGVENHYADKSAPPNGRRIQSPADEDIHMDHTTLMKQLSGESNKSGGNNGRENSYFLPMADSPGNDTNGANSGPAKFYISSPTEAPPDYLSFNIDKDKTNISSNVAKEEEVDYLELQDSHQIGSPSASAEQDPYLILEDDSSPIEPPYSNAITNNDIPHSHQQNIGIMPPGTLHSECDSPAISKPRKVKPPPPKLAPKPLKKNIDRLTEDQLNAPVAPARESYLNNNTLVYGESAGNDTYVPVMPSGESNANSTHVSPIYINQHTQSKQDTNKAKDDYINKEIIEQVSAKYKTS